ncbi:MAG: hypothetical protein U9N40_00480 [Euryarchaeota archaeon]|nr:hypothetical protein [Euryarchaeota archaeon]
MAEFKTDETTQMAILYAIHTAIEALIEALIDIVINTICVTEADTEITIETDLKYVKEALLDMQKAKLIKKTGGAYKII